MSFDKICEREYAEMDKWSSLLPILSPRSRNQVIQRIAARKQELREANSHHKNSWHSEQLENFLQNQQTVKKELWQKREANCAENVGKTLKNKINRQRKHLNYELFQVYLKQCNLIINEEKYSQQPRQRRKQNTGKTTQGLSSQQCRDFFMELRTKPKAGKPSLLKPIERNEPDELISSLWVVNQNQYELARFLAGLAVQKVRWNLMIWFFVLQWLS